MIPFYIPRFFSKAAATLENEAKAILVPQKTNFSNILTLNNQKISELLNQIVQLDPNSKLCKLIKERNFTNTMNRKKFVLSTPVGFLVRKSYVEFWESLQEGNSVVIDGPAGIGKSVMLSIFASHWREGLKKPIVYFPNLINWVTGKYPYLPKEADAVKDQQNVFYEQKELLLDLVHDLNILNPELKGPNDRPLKELYEEWKTGKYPLTTELFGQVLENLPKETLWIVDGLNVLYAPRTQYSGPDLKPIAAQQLSICLILDKVLGLRKRDKSKNYPLVVATTTRTDPRLKSALPEGISFKLLPPYSLNETELILQHYRQINYSFCLNSLTNQNRDSKYETNLRLQQLVSGGNGAQLLKTCVFQNLLY